MIVADSMLEAIRADLGRSDSVILVDMAEAVIAGASPEEAATVGRASISYAAVRELVPVIRQMRQQGASSESIRGLVRRAVAMQPGQVEGFLEAVAERALESVLGYETGG